MKRTTPHLILIVLLGVITLSSDETKNTLTPNSKTIGIIIRDKGWTIDELNHVAWEYLWKNGKLPNGVKFVEASVHIMLDDKDIMCEFTYHQGFGRALWTVKVGRDGKVRGFETAIMKEGHRSLEEKGVRSEWHLDKS